MDNTKNRCLTALAYKLVDHFPNVTLFGGFVRDILVTAEKFPFSQDYKFECDINDLDIIVKLDRERNHDDFMEYINATIRKSLTEWDWRISEVSDITDYEKQVGVRINIQHILTDVESHIDIVRNDFFHYYDLDVNQFKFNKKNGLFYGRVYENPTIYKSFEKERQAFNMKKMVLAKQCNMINKVTDPKAAKRCMKMIKRGWTILNLNPKIQIHRNEFLKQCQICLDETKGETTWIELTCSRCTICFDCFEKLLERINEEAQISCPTCRLMIEPW